MAVSVGVLAELPPLQLRHMELLRPWTLWEKHLRQNGAPVCHCAACRNVTCLRQACRPGLQTTMKREKREERRERIDALFVDKR